MKTYKIGEKVKIFSFSQPTYGIIKGFKKNRLLVLQDSTTTGALTEYSLRKKSYSTDELTFVSVGYSKDDALSGGYIYADKKLPIISKKKKKTVGKKARNKIKVGETKIARKPLIDSMWKGFFDEFKKDKTHSKTIIIRDKETVKQFIDDFKKSSYTKVFTVERQFFDSLKVDITRNYNSKKW